MQQEQINQLVCWVKALLTRVRRRRRRGRRGSRPWTSYEEKGLPGRKEYLITWATLGINAHLVTCSLCAHGVFPVCLRGQSTLHQERQGETEQLEQFYTPVLLPSARTSQVTWIETNGSHNLLTISGPFSPSSFSLCLPFVSSLGLLVLFAHIKSDSNVLLLLLLSWMERQLGPISHLLLHSVTYKLPCKPLPRSADAGDGEEMSMCPCACVYVHLDVASLSTPISLPEKGLTLSSHIFLSDFGGKIFYRTQ